jgi:hypothetical protein
MRIENKAITDALNKRHVADIEYHEACKAFSKAFRNKRIAEKLSLRQVSKELGITPAYLSDMELNRRAPNLDMRSYFDE